MVYDPVDLLHTFSFIGLDLGLVVFAACYTLMQILDFFKVGSK